MIGYYNYTVILTYMSLVSSVLGMFFAMGMADGKPHPAYAIICLMVSGLCDMFDGKVARTKKDRTRYSHGYGLFCWRNVLSGSGPAHLLSRLIGNRTGLK